MTKHVIYGAFGLLSAIVIAGAIYFDKPHSGTEAEISEKVTGNSEDQSASVAIAGDTTEMLEVTKVIDGDTIIVKIAGKTETVRLIGIDAPETGTNSECFATEATAALKSAVGGSKVTLEKDSSQGERDKYDRILAYVFQENGSNVGEELIAGGYVREYTYSKTYKYQKEYRAAEAMAKDNKKGLWAPDACAKPAPVKQVVEEPKPPAAALVEKKEPEPEKKTVKEEPEPEQESEPTEDSGPQNGDSYTCSTNTYNCSDFSTHAEAQAVYEQCGGASNDIHKLDSNKDGEACESLP